MWISLKHIKISATKILAKKTHLSSPTKTFLLPVLFLYCILETSQLNPLQLNSFKKSTVKQVIAFLNSATHSKTNLAAWLQLGLAAYRTHLVVTIINTNINYRPKY